jgi:hypothetical protein
MRLGNVEIPCPGCKGIATVQKSEGGIRIIKVDIYPPQRKSPITCPGDWWDSPYPDEDTARNAISKDIGNNPVSIVHI